MNNNELQQAAEKKFPMMPEDEFNKTLQHTLDIRTYANYQIGILNKRDIFIAGANWRESQQEGGESRIDELLRLQIEECRIHVDRCSRDVGQSSGQLNEWILSTPVIDYHKTVTIPLPAVGRSAEEVEKYFDNNSDCYADTWYSNGIVAEMTQGEVIPAMTKNAFLKYASQFKAVSAPAASQVEFLKEVLAEVSWLFDNMNTLHTSDHFNRPANLIQQLKDAIEQWGTISLSDAGEENKTLKQV